MLFNSAEFLFLFLPVVLLGFLTLQRLGNLTLLMAWLVASSLFFYAWWNPVYVLLILLSASVNYGLGLKLAAEKSEGTSSWLVLGILFNLGLLAYFKYANFFVDNIQVLLGTDFNFTRIILPLAISFYTFQQITYLVDTRRGLTAPHGMLEYLLFVTFFPQLIAGPIVHHSEMLKQFNHLTEKFDVGRQLAIGLSILAIGLFKKVVIADGLSYYATPVFNLAENGATLYALDAITATLAYTFQLYFDFSGYSDMAIGLACLFGIKLPVNFYSPYRAHNISDFWRMWHATLSRFLRDYVYSPLGGFLCSPNRQRFNLFCTMFVGGVWHGAGWTFVLYGFCHGMYVVIHQVWRIKVSGPLELVGNRFYQWSAQILTFLVVALTLVIFRADSVNAALQIYQAMADIGTANYVTEFAIAVQRTNLIQLSAILPWNPGPVAVVSFLLALMWLVCWTFPNTYQLFRDEDVIIVQARTGRPAPINLQWRGSTGWAVFTAMLVVFSLLNLNEVSEFLYFQF